MQRVIDFWASFSVLIVFCVAFLALVRWLDLGRRSLLRKKTVLLTELHDQLEKNPATGRAVAFLKESDPEKKLEHLITSESELLTETEVVIKNDLDALFRVLNRIAQAVTITKVLNREETEIFSGYFRLLQHHPILSEYFYNSGFLDLWDFAQYWMEKLNGDEVQV